jgi:hypothetical protein
MDMSHADDPIGRECAPENMDEQGGAGRRTRLRAGTVKTAVWSE